MVFPIGGKTLLELRIDIDKIHSNSPVLNRISGDFYQTYLAGSNGNSSQSNVYLGSWIVDMSLVISSSAPSSFEMYGNIRFWKGDHPKTTIKLIVYRMSNNSTEQAELYFCGYLRKYNEIRLHKKICIFSRNRIRDRHDKICN